MKTPAFDPGYETAIVHGCRRMGPREVMLGTFNLLDLVALDVPLAYWQPRFVVLPGTEGMAGYSHYWVSFKGFLIGIPLVIAASALLAAIVSAMI